MRPAERPTEAPSGSLLEMQLVIRFWKRERGRLIGIIALTAVSVAISLAFPYVLRYIVDGIQQGLQNAASFRPHDLFRYVAILVGFGVLRSMRSTTRS